MKKIALLALAAALVLSMTACGRKNEQTEQDDIQVPSTDQTVIPDTDSGMNSNIPDPNVNDNSTDNSITDNGQNSTDDTTGLQPDNGTATDSVN